MIPLKKLHYILYALFLVLFIQNIGMGQCSLELGTIGSGGVISWTGLSSSNDICPNTTYAIRVPGSTAAVHFARGTASNDVFFGSSGSVVPTNQAVCSAPTGSGAFDTIYFRVTGLSAQSITASDDVGGCNAGTTTVCTYNFVIAPAAVIAHPDITICDGKDVVINYSGNCSGTCTAGGGQTLTFEWQEDGGGYSAPSSSNNLTLNHGDYATYPSTFDVNVITNFTDNLSCINRDTITVTRQTKPSLSALNFASTTSANGKVCIASTEDVTATCSNCGSNSTTYTWSHDLNGGSATYTNFLTGNMQATTTGNQVFTIDPETGTYPPPTSNAELEPGIYNIRVIANLNTCLDTAVGILTVNDRPGVMMGWYNQDGANSGSDGYYANDNSNRVWGNDTVICAGSGLSFFVRGCGDGFLSGQYSDARAVKNYRGADPNTENIPNRPGGAYDCPCLESDLSTSNCTGVGDYYASLAWSVSSSNTANTGLSITGGANQTATSDCDIVADSIEVLTYRVDVTDANGCTNYDDIRIIARISDVHFRYNGTDYADGSTISVCESQSALSIDAWGLSTSYDDVVPFYGHDVNASPYSHTTYAWSQSSIANDLDITSGASSRTIVTDDPTSTNVGITSSYQVQMQDDWGCIGKGEIHVAVSEVAIDLTGTPTSICYGEPLTITNSQHSSGVQYDIYYDICPTCSGSSALLSNQNHPITINNPNAGTYYVVAKAGAGCESTANVVVSINPQITWTIQEPDTLVESCTDQVVILEAEAVGGTGLLTYSWNATGIGQGGAHTSSGGIMGTASSTGATGYYQWVFTGFFPTLVWVTTSTTDNNFTYYSNLPAQNNATNQLIVTDANGCSITHTWDFDIIECGLPSLSKEKTVFTTPNLPLEKYGCVNDVINLTCQVNSTSALGFTPKYEWSTGVTEVSATSLVNIPITSSSPDTIFTWCKVTNSTTDEIIGVVFDTTIVSRGSLSLYPYGDLDRTTVDTSICLNEVVRAGASCPGCRGYIEYLWDYNATGNVQLNGSTYDYHYFSGTVPNSTFTIPITVKHGEAPNYCIDSSNRQVNVDTLPNLSLIDANNNPISGPIYLCDGDVDTIRVNTLSCPTCYTFQWNTSANTEAIYVASQGGYYAEVIDGNSCRNVTDIALVISSNDGLNSPVIANPSQICSGNNAVLEVPPCIGCSYKWFDIIPFPNGTEVATTRAYATNSPNTYYAEITNAHGCVYPTNPITIGAVTLTTPSITGTTDSICLGETSVLSTTSGAGYMFQWYRNGTVISGAVDSAYIASEAGAYTVEVTYTNGCVEESSIFNLVSIAYKPNLIVIDSIVCSGSTAELMTDLYPNWHYQWYNNGIPIAGANGSIYHAVHDGTHSVEVTTDYLCVVRSDSVNIQISSLSKPKASTSTTSICPDEDAELSVSLCTSCNYQWFESNGTPITPNASSSNYRYVFSPSSSKLYYAEVSKDGCVVQSDTISITVNSVFTPAITSSSSVVCDGRDALLLTSNCVGCSYSWLLDGTPIPSALNDTFHLVSSISDTGNYQIAVTYPNSCTDTSSILKISDGSYDVSLTIDTSGGRALDSVICNGIGENLLSTPLGVALAGSYTHTLFLDNTPVTGQSNVTASGANYVFPGNTAGIYTVEVTDPRGCRALSNILPLRAVDITPVLAAHPTAINPIPARAICTDSGTVFMEVTVANCTNCVYDWLRGSSSLGHTNTTYTTAPGVLGTGLYIVNVTSDGCLASSNVITIANSIGTINSSANTTDTSICDGQSVTLEHAASMGSPSIQHSFRWLRNLQPISAATNYQYTTSTPGTYNLELTTSDGCVDTSGRINIRKVDPPTSLSLNFDTLVTIGTQLVTGTPLAANGSLIDMNHWVFPDSVRHDSLGGSDFSYFSSAPFNAALNCNGALPCNPGLSGVDSVFFTPNDTLAGYHLISYHYNTQGCAFVVSDVLEVLPPAAITVTNTNPASVSYEACVGDDLIINTINLNYSIDEVYAYDVNDNYILLPLNSVTTTSDTFGTNVRWNTTINLTVPGFANASSFMLVNSALNDTTYTSYVLIHNTDLSFTGLPNMLCSNGEGITLFGNPSGGTFYTTSAGNPSAILPGTTIGDTLYPTLLNQAAYTNGNQWIDVYYSYTETYTNGNLCPSNDTVSIRKEVKDVRLTDVTFNTISVSQQEELLTNLVYQVSPYQARPNKQPLYTSSFSGSFTNPAGNPTTFLPANAGVGKHALTYYIESGDCINSVEDSVTVVAAPTPIPIPDTICRNFGTVTFSRDAAFPYTLLGSIYPAITTIYTDTFYTLTVTGAGVSNGNTNPGSETFAYNPNIVVGNYDTLIIEYRYYRDEDTLNNLGIGVNFDTLDYVVAKIVHPIYIEDLSPVTIIDTIVNPFYCQEDKLHLLAGSPSNNAFGGGRFMLYGGTNQYQFGDTLHNNVINPYQVNHQENATTVYDLVYILNGAACQNSDTIAVTISKGLYPAFATVSGGDEYCDTDPDEVITHNVTAPDTAIWKIGGVPQGSYVFPPDPLDPGIHVVELQMVDTFGCTASALDTFTIHALPALALSPGLDNQYCNNDTPLNFVVTPSPDCPSYAAPGQAILNEQFNSGIPPSWNTTNAFAGKTWIGSTGSFGGAAFIDSSQVLNDSWLISSPLNLVAGHRYQLTYMVQAGALDSTCAGFCNARLSVYIGATATAPMPTNLVPQLIVHNDLTYARYTVEHYHDPSLGFTTGQYYLGFRSVTPALGRSLLLDNVRMRDLTIGSCAQNGIGYIDGPGIHRVIGANGLIDSTYQFNPLAVDAGNVDIKYIYTDINGCQDSLVYPVIVDTTPVVSFTSMDPFYCENEPTIMLTGAPLGGTFTSSMGTNLVHIPFYAPLDTAFFPVNYQTNTSGVDTVSYSYTDANGCSNTARDTVMIVAMLDSNAINQAALDPQGDGHCAYDTLALLDVVAISGIQITDGTFYGPGVRNGAGGVGVATFHPDSAVLDMGHTGDVTLTYIYTVPPLMYGCVDTTRLVTRVHAAPDLSFVNLPDSLCLNRDSFQVQVQNNVVTGSMGQISYTSTLGAQVGTFTEVSSDGTPLPNFIYLFDTLYPSSATGHSQVNISYTYVAGAAFGNCYSTIYDSIRIDTVPIAYFQGLQDSYCENDSTSIFLAFPSYRLGSGYLQIGTNQIDSSFYWINPAAMVGPGPSTATYPTYYTYTDARGCTGEVFDTFVVNAYPRIVLNSTYQDTFCRQVGRYDLRQALVSPLGGFFTDNLALTSIEDSFFLNLNSLAGPRLVTYHYTDPTTGCQNKESFWMYIFNGPDLDFTIYGGCAQMDITFDPSASNLVQGIDSITRIWWDFEGNGTTMSTGLDTSPILIPDTAYHYTTSGVYNVTLYVENRNSCVDTVTKELIISPYYDLATDYFEDFNAGPGDWHDDQPIGLSSTNIWTHENNLNSSNIKNTDGFWVTTAVDTFYDQGQAAWVYSPCFDFTSSKRPMIAFDLWRDVSEDIDGVVMEFYNNSTNQWELLGSVGEGIKWYQGSFVLARPGNQNGSLIPIGWTGRSDGFESARLRLDQFKGQRDVRFRIAFASSAQSVLDSIPGVGYEGAAFDNVWIGERTRNVLVEHFNNVNYTTVAGNPFSSVDQSVYDNVFNSSYGLDVVLIQYQINIPSLAEDSIFGANPADLGSRRSYYSVDPNTVLIDGQLIAPGYSDSLDQKDLDYEMLQFPDFKIDIDTVMTIVGQTLFVEADVEALVDKDSTEYIIHTVIIQDSFTYHNNFNMLSIARKMLPDHGGRLMRGAWAAGDTAHIIANWDYSGQLGQTSFNETQLEAVVFIQESSTQEVLQVATSQDLNRYVGTKKLEDEVAIEIFSLNVYPNPSNRLFNVEFDKALEGDYNWRLIDVTGRTLQTGIATRGTQKFVLDAERLVDGAYFFVIHSDDNKTYAQRKLIVIK